MSNLDKQLNRLREEYHRDTNKNAPIGVLGKGDDENTLTDSTVPGHVWVREWTDGSYSTARSVLNALPDGTRIYSGLGVQLGFKNGERAVTDIDRSVNPQTRRSPYTPQESIPTLLVKPTNPPSLSVQVIGGNFVVDRTTYFIPTTDDTTNPDLSSLVPASGEHCYAVVYLKDDYATFEAFASTPQSVLLDLDETDADECHVQSSTDSYAVWAVRLHDGQNTIGNDDVYTLGKDLRTPFGNASSNARALRKIIMNDHGYPISNDHGFFVLRDS